MADKHKPHAGSEGEGKQHLGSLEMFGSGKSLSKFQQYRLWSSKPYETGLEVFTLFATSLIQNSNICESKKLPLNDSSF